MMHTGSSETIGFVIVDLARLFRQNLDRAVAAEGLGLTAGEARTLLHVGSTGALRQSALARRMCIEPMTLSGFLDRLEKRGLVTRERDPDDARAKIVTVTAAAEPLIARIRAIATEVRGRACADLPEGELDALRATLLGMRSQLAEMLGEGPE